MESHHSKQTYVLTHDVGARIESLGLLGIATLSQEDPFFSDFERRLRRKIETIFPDVDVVDYNMPMLSGNIWAEALRKKAATKHAIVVSTCLEMATPRRGHTLEINRIVDINGEIIGFGPRPGSPSLSKQVASIANLVNGAPIVLVEDGAFSGSTIKEVLRRFQACNTPVASVVLGFSFPGVAENIQNEFSVEVMSVKDVKNPVDWMPDHDFLPLVPNCGRVYGHSGDSGEASPFYSVAGDSYSIPYIQPFGNLEKWAAIPEGKGVDLSRFCLEYTIRMFTKIESMNSRELTFAHFNGSQPSISIPLVKGNEVFPSADTPILQFLREALATLN
jgi:hypothetical protein